MATPNWCGFMKPPQGVIAKPTRPRVHSTMCEQTFPSSPPLEFSDAAYEEFDDDVGDEFGEEAGEETDEDIDEELDEDTYMHTDEDTYMEPYDEPQTPPEDTHSGTIITATDIHSRRSRPTPRVIFHDPHPALTAAQEKRLRLPLGHYQKIKYQNYKYTIPIYHYSFYILPLATLLNTFRRAVNGFHHTNITVDPLHHVKCAPGDEPPPGRIEVVYLGNVFRTSKGCRGEGSAIGFRDKSKNRVEWVCFTEPSDHLIESARGPRGEILFDLVAKVDKRASEGKGKGNHAVSTKGCDEHREWYENVTSGIRKTERVVLTWKNKEREMREAIASGDEVSRESWFVKHRKVGRSAEEWEALHNQKVEEERRRIQKSVQWSWPNVPLDLKSRMAPIWQVEAFRKSVGVGRSQVLSPTLTPAPTQDVPER